MLTRKSTVTGPSTIATVAVAHIAARRIGRTWGAIYAEAEKPLPSDDLVPGSPPHRR